MRKYAVLLATGALVASLETALAAEKVGKIIVIDLGRDQIQVGETTIMIEGVKLDGLKVGDTVHIEVHYDDLGYHLQSIKKE